MQESINTISQSFRRFFTGTLFSRITGFARETIMAALFGITPEIAAFWMAFRFAHILRRLFGEGGLHVAFVPHFEGLRKKNPTEAYNFFMGLALGLGGFLILLGVLIEIFLGGFLIWGNLGAGTREIIRLTFIMLPSFIFVSLYSLNASLLQCEKSFFLPSIAPSLLNLLWVISLPFLPKSSPLIWLSFVVVLGLGLKWLVTWIAVLRRIRPHLTSIQWLKLKDYLVLLKPFSLALIGVAATQVNTLFDSLFARFASEDGPAVLWYALRLQQLPLALIGVGVSSAFFPPIARAVENGDAGYKNLLHAAMLRAFAFMIPITLALFAIGFAGVNFVYGRGAFDSSAIQKTSFALFGYGLGLLPSTLVFILASSFYARKNYRVPTLISCLSVLLNLVLNAFFVFVMHMGALSIAISTSLAACFNALLLGILLRREIGMFGRGLLGNIIKISIASLAAMLLTILIGHRLFQDNTLLLVLNKTFLPFPAGIMKQGVVVGSLFAIFVGTFLGLSYFMKSRAIFETILPKRLQNKIL